MAKVPNAVEILRKVWTAWVRCTSVTVRRQTTDGRASEREREFTFAENVIKLATHQRGRCTVKLTPTEQSFTIDIHP